MTMKRLIPLSGAIFVALWIVAVFALNGEGTPEAGATADEVVSFYDAHMWQQTAVAFLLAVSVPFLVLFAASVSRAWPARDAEGAGIWHQVLVGGGILGGATVLASATVHFSIPNGVDEGIPATALQTLNVLDNNFWVGFNAGLGVMMLGAAGVVLSRSGERRWLGWTALVLGIALFIPFADFFALLLTALWIVVTGVALARASRETPTMTHPQAAHQS